MGRFYLVFCLMEPKLRDAFHDRHEALRIEVFHEKRKERVMVSYQIADWVEYFGEKRKEKYKKGKQTIFLIFF